MQGLPIFGGMGGQTFSNISPGFQFGGMMGMGGAQQQAQKKDGKDGK